GLKSVRTLAESAGLHPVHFARTFRRATGTTLRAWRRRVRVWRAVGMLAAGVQPLASVALATGFADQAHFSRSFRLELGIAPSEYVALSGRSACVRTAGRA